jgi:hypothetical protein
MGERAAVERPVGGAQTHTPHTDDPHTGFGF